MYKLVAMDLDGTLFNPDREISPNNQKAIEALKARNAYVVIASGRTYDDIGTMVRSLGLSEYPRAFFICYNGVIAAKTRPYQVIYQKMIHAEDVRRIGKLAEEGGLKLHVFAKNKIYLSDGIEHVIQSDFGMISSAERIRVSEYRGEDEVYKILIVDHDEKLNQFQKTIPPEFREEYAIFKSATHLLEFVHKDGSKGQALAALTKHLNLLPEEVMAFGDEENDISMLQFAGMGVAMENAKPNVKRMARMITLSNKMDGVAEVIRQYILEVDSTHGI